MEKLLNPYDKEYVKMAMLKHEETFRDQVNELHRLYGIQKILMKDIAKSKRNEHYTAQCCKKPEARKCLDLGDRAEEFNITEPGEKCRVLEIEDDQSDLELTLGLRSYYQRKIKAAEPAVIPSDSGLSFSSSSTGSMNHIKRSRNISTREEFLSQQKWGMEMGTLSNQERLDNNPHWLFQVLSLNMT